ncbi:hypothetical protein BWI93_07290 [Siphonobacter sp. BAB-5385]|nr:hypothetical protein BWI93_07290 [Siphonobacter sp. BAB-5385]PMD92559.1 hypothetical protein BWI97_20985 [Siphonobacter sp. BAB-5405]
MKVENTAANYSRSAEEPMDLDKAFVKLSDTSSRRQVFVLVRLGHAVLSFNRIQAIAPGG